METSALALKTEKGQEEIRSRAHGLPQKLRALLIMVDGKSSIGQILGRFPGVTEIENHLRQLIEQGFISLSGAAAISAGAGVRSAAPAIAAETRELAVRQLTRMVLESAGPAADMVTGDLERARTRAEFDKAVARCVAMIEGMASARKAEAFSERAASCASRWFAG